MGFILFIVAIVLTSFVSVLSLVFTPIYYISTLKWKSGLKELNKWFYKVALSIDQTGNVLCAKTLQALLTKPLGAFQFGDEDDTVSYIIARNKNRNTLTAFGRFNGWILDKLEKNHLDNAIKNKIIKDHEAKKRIDINNYYE